MAGPALALTQSKMPHTHSELPLGFDLYNCHLLKCFFLPIHTVQELKESY
uniref:Uncharacterized protein n=1 Tax=Arundo donax TaxID=35708 RepID=A0A0A8Y2G1_ARUDO